MKEINKPSQTKHWIANSEDGSIMHEGITEPNQVTSTGLHTLEGFDSEEERVTYIGTMDVGMFPTIPEVGQECIEGKIYAYGDNKSKCLQSHNRMSYTPEETPALWTIIPTVSDDYSDVEDWDGANWLAYQTVGYLVKYDGKIWASKLPISHTWIAPAKTGDGSISWEFVADVI